MSLLTLAAGVLLAGAQLCPAAVVGSTSVVLDASLVDKPNPISGHVDLTTAQTGELAVTINWEDSYGRVADQQVTLITLPGQTSVNFSFPTDVGLTLVSQITASAVFTQTSDTLSSSSQSWDLVPDPVDHEDYHANVWGDGATGNANYFAAIEQANVDNGHIYREASYSGHNYNVRPNHDFIEDKRWFELTDAQHDPNYNIYEPSLTSTYDYYLPVKRQALIRYQSLSSTSSLNELINAITLRMQYTRKWRPMQWNIADEYGTGKRDYPFDYDLDSACIDQFIIWLQSEYASIGELNSQWGTSFSDWPDLSDPINAPQGGEAALIICQEMRDRELPLYTNTTGAKNFSPWSDFRRHMELTMVNAMQQCVDAARAIDTGVPIGWEGGETVSPMNGYDYWLQMQLMGSFEAYDNGNAPEFARSFRDNKYGDRLFRWITAFDSGSQNRNRYKLWFHLIHHGHRASIIWWYQNFFTDTSSYNLTSYATGLALAYGQFRSGLAKLLSQGEHDDSEVALYYSQRSNHITWQYDSEPNGNTWLAQKSADRRQRSLFYTHTGWLKALEDAGIKGRFVSYEQITNGELISEGYKVLIMPLVMAMSAAEVSAVQAFADAGGVVVADSQTATWDDHCKRPSIATGGQMDSWFGIDRLEYHSTERNKMSSDAYAGSVYLQTPPVGFEALTQDLSSPVSAGWHAVERGVRVADGTAVGLFDNDPDQPVLIVKDHGAGKSVYMNLTLFRYAWSGSNFSHDRQTPSSPASQNVRKLVRNLAALGGVSPQVNVLRFHDAPDPPSGLKVYCLEKARYVDGQNTYLACVVNSAFHAYDWSSQADPGLTLFGQSGANVADVTLVLDTTAHVYDVRTGSFPDSYLGYGTRINASQPVLEGGVFALLPYQVTGLNLDSISFDSKQRASVTVSVQTSGGSPGRHVFRLEALDPVQQEMKHLRRNVVAPAGVWSGVIPFAVDENITGGSIRITDVATGAQLLYYIGNVPPVINEVTPDPDTAVVGYEYSKQLTLSEGIPPITWTLLDSPVGAQVDQNGLVDGWTVQPWQIGKSFTLEAKAQNAFGFDTESWQVQVPPAIPGFFEQGGMVVMEAEHYDSIKAGVAPVDDVWTLQTGHFSVGDGYMQALPDNGDNVNDPDIESLSPRMSYVVNFSATGTYYLWARSEGPDNSGDSFHYGLDGDSISTTFDDSAAVPKSGQLEWQSQLTSGGQPTITIGSPGTYSVDIWMREDGCMIDRLLLTTDSGYTPGGSGPDESARVVSLIPGDLDHDGDIDLDDYVLFEDALDGPGVAPSNPEADLDNDGDCDLEDCAIFAKNFSGSAG